MRILKFLVVAISIAVLTQSAAAEQPVLHLIPTPKEIKIGDGKLHLAAGARIVATAKVLTPLAQVLSDDMQKISGVKLATAEGADSAGDIVLSIDSSLRTGEARHWPHSIAVTDRVRIAGRDYNAAAMATATLLQLLEIGPDGIDVPRLSLSDFSAAEYPGLMLDVARQNNTLQDVRNCVELCRLYEVRYLHLHLNDMESFMFPSKLFPKLGTHNGSAFGGPKCKLWDRDELLATIKFADERGVEIVPELETVFHTGAMMQDMPNEFGGPGVLNIGSEKLYQSLEPLIEEMCDVFKSSPFFQIGCDEASIGGVMEAPGTKQYMEQHQINSGEDLYRFHINRLDKVVTRKGKRTIVWQDCPLPLDNKNIICMIWHIDFDHGDTGKFIKEGYPTIQVTWTPSVNSSVRQMFDWRPFDEQIAPSKLAMGSQLVLWEQNGSVAIPALRQKMPARQQWTYSPNASLGVRERMGTGSEQPVSTTSERVGREVPVPILSHPLSYSQFAESLAHTDSLLDPLISGMTVSETGLTQNVDQWLQAGGIGPKPDDTFVKSMRISLKCNLQSAKIHYTVTQIPTYSATLLYGKEPTADSPIADGPITVSPPEGEAVCVEARLFDEAGKPMGGTWTRTYRWQPFAVRVKGTIADGDNRFGKSVTIEPLDAVSGGTVRYSMGESVTAASPALEKPITLDASGEVSIRYFDAKGKPHGLAWKQSFHKVDFDPTNVTYKKPVIQWGSSSKQAAEVAVDGVVDHEQFLDIQPGPQEFAIDLEAPKNLNKVVLYTYWDGGRFYQYKIDVSTDRKQWTTVADASKNQTIATEKGYAHTFAPTEARYLRVTMLRNSANPGLHIVELRAYEAK